MLHPVLGVTVLGLHLLPGVAMAGGHDFTVRLMNWAKADGYEVRRAMQIANAALSRASFEAEWMDCTPDEHGFAPSETCGTAAGPMDIRLSIHASAPPRINGWVLGLTTYPDSGPPDRAVIFMNRVREFARTNGSGSEVVLGYVMVHEVGHILLGSDSHSGRGVMRRSWSADDLQAAAQGRLEFSPRQVRSMQAGLFERRLPVASNGGELALRGAATDGVD